ncbi:MAG: D-aminoacyl-tRNA deacylase [Bacilli bacterium]
MKIVIQNVLKASVSINGEIYSSINKGYLLLVSFTIDDNIEICKKMAQKISTLRIFDDENGKTNLSIKDVGGNILSVSQFTLYADCRHGNRPSFTSCMKQEEANLLYEDFNKELIKLGFDIKTGVFRADMKVSLVNDGPFTIILDSKEIF